jgi:hypothetical protein
MEACTRSGRIIESVVCLIFAGSCGTFAVNLSKWSSKGRWPRVILAVRSLILSGWPAVVAATPVWKFPKASMEPLVTTTLSLFLLAAFIARYGPSTRRLELSMFAAVGLMALALAFGPWTTGSPELVPAGRLCEPIARMLYPSEDANMLYSRRNQIQADVYLGVVLGAWFLAIGSARISRWCIPSETEHASHEWGGEPCPS